MNDIPYEKINWEVLPKSHSDRSMNLNRQLHKIVTYYWISREHVKELTAVMLFSLISVALFHPTATLIWTQMLPAPLQEAEHTSLVVEYNMPKFSRAKKIFACIFY